jgi:hypothetical protein
MAERTTDTFTESGPAARDEWCSIISARHRGWRARCEMTFLEQLD